MNPEHKKYVIYAIWAQLFMFILVFLYIDKAYADTLTDLQSRIMLYAISFDGAISAYLLEKYAPDPEIHHRRIIKYAPLIFLQFILFIIILIVWRWYLYPTQQQIQILSGLFLFESIFTAFYFVIFYKKAKNYITAVQMPPSEDNIEVHQSIKMARRIIFLLLLIPIVLVWVIISSFNLF